MNEALQWIPAAVQFLVLLLALSAHEAGHAWMAARCGDGTALSLHRGSLNPLRHLEPFGSLILPFLLSMIGAPLFGWGRPTPVLVPRLRDPRRQLLWIALAGPAANLALSLAGLLLLLALLPWAGPEAGEIAAASIHRQPSPAVVAHGAYPLIFTLVQVTLLNAFLAAFHLLPLPPLDGCYFLVRWLPRRAWRVLRALQPFGFAIATGLALFGFVTILLQPLYRLLDAVSRL